jgi:hypothetical protein
MDGITQKGQVGPPRRVVPEMTGPRFCPRPKVGQTGEGRMELCLDKDIWRPSTFILAPDTFERDAIAPSPL